MFDEFRILLATFITCVLIVAVCSGAIVGLVAMSQNQYCKTMSSLQSGFEFQWNFWTGCLVQTPNGYWVKADKYQYIEGDMRFAPGGE